MTGRRNNRWSGNQGVSQYAFNVSQFLEVFSDISFVCNDSHPLEAHFPKTSPYIPGGISVGIRIKLVMFAEKHRHDVGEGRKLEWLEKTILRPGKRERLTGKLRNNVKEISMDRELVHKTIFKKKNLTWSRRRWKLR